MDDKPVTRHAAISRREFCGHAGAAALSFTVLSPGLVRGSQANSRVRLGMIGCGGRGTWIADLFKKHGGYNVVAAFDYFQDKVDAAGDKLGVPSDKPFRSDDFADALDYAAVVKRVQALAADHPHHLMERFAQAIADIVVGEFAAPWVKVRVAKLAPIAGVRELGVAIERRRAAPA